MCLTCILGTCGDQKVALDPWNWSYNCEPPFMCWEWNLVYLTEQRIGLTTKTSLQLSL